MNTLLSFFAWPVELILIALILTVFASYKFFIGPKKKKERDIRTILLISSALRELKEIYDGEKNQLPAALVAFEKSLGQLEPSPNIEGSTTERGRKVLETLERLRAAGLGELTIESASQLTLEFRECMNNLRSWRARLDLDFNDKPTISLLEFSLAYTRLLNTPNGLTVENGSLAEMRGRNILARLAPSLRDLQSVAAPVRAEKPEVMALRLEPARITLTATAALLVGVGFAFSTLVEGELTDSRVKWNLLWLLIYVSITVLFAGYQAFSIYSFQFNWQRVLERYDRGINTVIYIMFALTVVRGVVVLPVILFAEEKEFSISPVCCTALSEDVDLIRKRVDKLDEGTQVIQKLGIVLDKVVVLIGSLETNRGGSVTDLSDLESAIRDVDITLRDIKSEISNLKSPSPPEPIQVVDPETQELIRELTRKQNEVIDRLLKTETALPKGGESYLALSIEVTRLMNTLSNLAIVLASSTGGFADDTRDVVKHLLKKIGDKLIDAMAAYLEGIIDRSSSPPSGILRIVEQAPLSVFFGENISKVDPASIDREKIEKFRAAFKAKSECWLIARGYADTTGSESRNLLLSYWRAQETVKYVIGDAGDRLIVSGLGETKARPTDRSGEADPADRRAELLLLCPVS